MGSPKRPGDVALRSAYSVGSSSQLSQDSGRLLLLDVRHLVGARGHDLEILVHDLALCEGQRFTDLANSSLDV